MKAILAPAMNMNNFELNDIEKTIPIFKNKTIKIIEELKKLDPFELESELGLSVKLQEKVFGYYYDFDCINFEKKGTQALMAFQGLAYKNMNVEDFTKEDYIFANESIRILSALYGVLKPTDIIQQYRLDFKSNFAKKGIDGNKLYEYWGRSIYHELFKSGEVIVGICSNEYEKAIVPYLTPKDKYVSCKFMVKKNGKFKTCATIAKMARGQMARYIVKNRIKDIEKLKDFYFDGFEYSDYHSDDKSIVFIK